MYQSWDIITYNNRGEFLPLAIVVVLSYEVLNTLIFGSNCQFLRAQQLAIAHHHHRENQHQIADLKSETNQQFVKLKSEMNHRFAQVDEKIDQAWKAHNEDDFPDNGEPSIQNRTATRMPMIDSHAPIFCRFHFLFEARGMAFSERNNFTNNQSLLTYRRIVATITSATRSN